MMSDLSTRSRNSARARVLAQIECHGFLVARVHRPEEVRPPSRTAPMWRNGSGPLRPDLMTSAPCHRATGLRTAGDQGADLDHADAVSGRG